MLLSLPGSILALMSMAQGCASMVPISVLMPSQCNSRLLVAAPLTKPNRDCATAS